MRRRTAFSVFSIPFSLQLAPTMATKVNICHGMVIVSVSSKPHHKITWPHTSPIKTSMVTSHYPNSLPHSPTPSPHTPPPSHSTTAETPVCAHAASEPLPHCPDRGTRSTAPLTAYTPITHPLRRASSPTSARPSRSHSASRTLTTSRRNTAQLAPNAVPISRHAGPSFGLRPALLVVVLVVEGRVDGAAEEGGGCGVCGREFCFLEAEDVRVGPAAEGGAGAGG